MSTDADLLAAHVAGDPHAFGTLFRRHQDHLWAIAVRTSYTREDAADALQDAMLSAHRTASTFRADSAVRSWLHTIVVNACLDRIRRNKTRPAVSLEAIPAYEPLDERNHYSGVEMSLVVSAALADLPADQRAALVAVDVEGRSIGEAAQLLGIPVGTVKSRCARGRLRLAEKLEFLRDPGNRE